jgi:hypothetical protein
MENNVTTQEEQPLTVQTRQPKGLGFECEVDTKELIIPRAKLLQALSPEVEDAPDIYKPGMIINSVTKDILSDTFIPIFYWQEWIRFNPRNSESPGFDPSFAPGGLIWRSMNPQDPRVREEGSFGPNNEKPLATKFFNFFSLFEGEAMPVVIGFSNYSFPAGRTLYSLSSYAGGNLFDRTFKISTKKIENEKGKFFIMQVALNSNCTDAQKEIAKNLHRDFAFRKESIVIDNEDSAHEESSERPY